MASGGAAKLSETKTLTIYADGSVASNNSGGVGIRIISIDLNGDEVVYDTYLAGYPNANSGQMEIIACIASLEEAVRLQLTLLITKIVILTDSKYVYENYQTAKFEWSKSKWLRKTGRPVQDAHLWKELVMQIRKLVKDHIYVEINWIKGHEKDKHNIYVDQMAKKASKLPLDKIPRNAPISILQPRKISASPKMEIGSVKMNGQKISIRILSSKLLKPQNLWCYQYQVISRNSPFRDSVDQIFSNISLDTNKSYFVKFNSVTENPRIEKSYREISNMSIRVAVVRAGQGV
jgi:ribonuclease HI